MDPYYTPPLSLEGWREIEDEIANGSPMTPERRAMFERVWARESIRKRASVEAETAKRV
ncbi:MAG TPA: hypothetical protein VLK84_31035 [Longimicrobium sp.]|nr:hypothetical protein [Longimicrobium sp.]